MRKKRHWSAKSGNRKGRNEGETRERQPCKPDLFDDSID